MDLGSLRTLALSLNLSTHGVPATVTLPAPDNTPISTRGIWLSPAEETRPFGTDLARQDARRVMALSRADVPAIVRGATVEATEPAGTTAKRWRVDGHEQAAEAGYWRVFLILMQG